MDRSFGLSKSTTDDSVHYNCCRIIQDDDGSLTINMEAYVNNISVTDISRAPRKQYNDMVHTEEIPQFRKLACVHLCWLKRQQCRKHPLHGRKCSSELENAKLVCWLNLKND